MNDLLPHLCLDRQWRGRRVAGVKQILVMMAAVVLVGCGNVEIANPIIENAALEFLEKPEGKLTEEDLGKVTGLYLGNTKITNEGLKEVAKFQQLETLFLSNTQITDAGLKEVAKLQKLTSLFLDRTQITDAGLKELVKLQNLSGLNLGGAQITDAGLVEVAKLQKLVFLELRGTKITDAGVAELRKALPNCNITGP